MRTFTFKLQKDPGTLVFKKLLEAAKRKKFAGDKDIFLCESYPALLKSMNKSRFEAFSMIAEKKPTSIYELAKILNRDTANVLRDVKALEMLKLIKLVKSKNDPKNKIKPVALYDKIIFDLDLMKATGT
jgi:predicted transcriptional regulator